MDAGSGLDAVVEAVDCDVTAGRPVDGALRPRPDAPGHGLPLRR